MRKDGSHGAALPAELCHQDRAQHLCDGGLRDSRECHGGRDWQPPAGKDHGVCVCLDARAWHLHDGECHGSGVCLDTRAEHLQGRVCLGAGECPDTRASQLCDPVCGDAWAPLLCCATCHLWAPRPSLGLAPLPSLGMTTKGWACDGDECGGGSSDDQYDDQYEKYDDVRLYFMNELYNLFVVKPCWASMVLQGTRLVPGELKRWRRSWLRLGRSTSWTSRTSCSSWPWAYALLHAACLASSE